MSSQHLSTVPVLHACSYLGTVVVCKAPLHVGVGRHLSLTNHRGTTKTIAIHVVVINGRVDLRHPGMQRRVTRVRSLEGEGLV